MQRAGGRDPTARVVLFWCALLSIELLREAAVLTAAGDGVEWPADLDTVIHVDKQ